MSCELIYGKMELFNNKYNTKTLRLPHWDYSSAGYYFITICTFKKQKLLGEIENNSMFLSDTGELVQKEWSKSFDLRKELFCDLFTIMPNHIHSIIIIDNKSHENIDTYKNNFSLKPKSISSFISGFKASVTKQVRQSSKILDYKVWQNRFYERVIRNESELNSIRQYIQYNPLNWDTDENNPIYQN